MAVLRNGIVLYDVQHNCKFNADLHIVKCSPALIVVCNDDSRRWGPDMSNDGWHDIEIEDSTMVWERKGTLSEYLYVFDVHAVGIKLFETLRKSFQAHDEALAAHIQFHPLPKRKC